MTQPRHIHLIGICGTAMASLAGMLQERGFRVTGSDAASYPPMSTFLESLGIPVAQPFTEANLQPRPDLVVVGNALSRGNVELEYLLDRRIPFCSLPQILHDEFLLGKEVLVVAGTNGKTTTTSMLAWIFETAGLQPSFLIGASRVWASRRSRWPTVRSACATTGRRRPTRRPSAWRPRGTGTWQGSTAPRLEATPGREASTSCSGPR